MVTGGWGLSCGVDAVERRGFLEVLEAFRAGLVADGYTQRAVAEFLTAQMIHRYRRSVTLNIDVHMHNTNKLKTTTAGKNASYTQA